MPSVATPKLSDEAARRDALADEGRRQRGAQADDPRIGQRSTVQALGMDPLGAQVRLVSFYDTPDLQLESAGVVVRARRVAGKGDDSVVKLRPVVPSELPRKVRESPWCMVEVDAMPGGFVCSASMKGVPEHARARRRGRDRAAAQALLQGAARLLRRPRPRGHRLRGPRRCWARSSCSSSRPARRASRARWSSSCGCTPTARGSSSSRRSAPPTRPSRSPPRAAPS